MFYAEPDAFMIYPIYTSPDVYAHNSNHSRKPYSLDDYTLYASHDAYVLFALWCGTLYFMQNQIHTSIFMIYPIYTSHDVYAHNSNHSRKPYSSDDYTLYTSHDAYVLFLRCNVAPCIPCKTRCILPYLWFIRYIHHLMYMHRNPTIYATL